MHILIALRQTAILYLIQENIDIRVDYNPWLELESIV